VQLVGIAITDLPVLLPIQQVIARLHVCIVQPDLLPGDDFLAHALIMREAPIGEDEDAGRSQTIGRSTQKGRAGSEAGDVVHHRQGNDGIEGVMVDLPVTLSQINGVKCRCRSGQIRRPFLGYLDQVFASVHPHIIHLLQAFIQEMSKPAISAAQIQHLTAFRKMRYNAIPARLCAVTRGRKRPGKGVVEIAIYLK